VRYGRKLRGQRQRADDLYSYADDSFRKRTGNVEDVSIEDRCRDVYDCLDDYVHFMGSNAPFSDEVNLV